MLENKYFNVGEQVFNYVPHSFNVGEQVFNYAFILKFHGVAHELKSWPNFIMGK